MATQAQLQLNDDKFEEIPGSIDRPYRLAIVGGGPSGNSVIVRALRLGVINDLCAGNASEAGVCILDKDSRARYGGGRLQDYIINSNSYASKFVTNVLSEKLEVDPPERIVGTTLTSLESLPTRHIVEGYGNGNLPLNLVGDFLRDVGETVMNTLAAYPASRCTTNVKVLGLQRVVSPIASKLPSSTGAQIATNASIVDKVNSLGLAVGTGTSEQSGLLWRIDTCSALDSPSGGKERVTQEIYAKSVMLATGGRQVLPKFANATHTAKVMLSDHVCTAEGAQELKERLQLAGVFGKPARVVIVGGSHSAFSAAWICLNKVHQPATSAPPSIQKLIGTEATSSNSAESATPSKPPLSNGSTIANGVGPLCFGSGSIVMTHRSSIKVFYGSKREAENDNYTDIGQINRVTGQIHPFGGLRGDAKELFRSIRSSKEGRIRLLSLSRTGGGVNNTLVNKLYDDAAVIIWACGYTTNQPIIKDIDGSVLSIRYFRDQVEVDEKAHIMSERPLNIVSFESKVPTIETAESKIGKLQIATDNNQDSSVQSPSKAAGLGSSSIGGSRASSPCKSARTTSETIPVKECSSPTSAKVHYEEAGKLSISSKANLVITAPAASAQGQGPYRIPGLLGSGLGYGFKATFENGEPDGSSGRADGVAVYLKRGATLVLAAVLGTKVFGEGVKSWEQRTAIINNTRRAMFQSIQQAATASVANGGAQMLDSPVAEKRAALSTSLKSPATRPTASSSSSSSSVNATKPMSINKKSSLQQPNTSASTNSNLLEPSSLGSPETNATIAAINNLTQSMESVKQGIESLLDNAMSPNGRSPSRPQSQSQSQRLSMKSPKVVSLSMGVDELEKQIFEPVFAKGNQIDAPENNVNAKQSTQPPQQPQQVGRSSSANQKANPRRSSVGSTCSTSSSSNRATPTAPTHANYSPIRAASSSGRKLSGGGYNASNSDKAVVSNNNTTAPKVIDDIVERLTRPKRTEGASIADSSTKSDVNKGAKSNGSKSFSNTQRVSTNQKTMPIGGKGAVASASTMTEVGKTTNKVDVVFNVDNGNHGNHSTKFRIAVAHASISSATSRSSDAKQLSKIKHATTAVSKSAGSPSTYSPIAPGARPSSAKGASSVSTNDRDIPVTMFSSSLPSGAVNTLQLPAIVHPAVFNSPERSSHEKSPNKSTELKILSPVRYVMDFGPSSQHSPAESQGSKEKRIGPRLKPLVSKSPIK